MSFPGGPTRSSVVTATPRDSEAAAPWLGADMYCRRRLGVNLKRVACVLAATSSLL